MKKTAKNEILTYRFFMLSIVTTLILLALTVISINSFGEAAWEGQRRVGIIIAGSKDEPGRNRAHYLGLKAACDNLNCDLMLRENIPETAGMGKKAALELINGGANTIFLINGTHAADVAELAEQYPNVRFFLSGLYSMDNGKIREYSVRDYEARYLSGLLAGYHTKTGCVGYIAPYSSSGINRGINAFTIGVKKANPNAKVLLAFTGSTDNRANEERAVQMLKIARADVISYHQDSSTVAYAAERSSMYFIAFHEMFKDCGRCLGAITMNWEKAYTDMLKSDKASAYNVKIWPGMAENMIDLELMKHKLSTRELAVVETERTQLKRGKAIFSGEIYDRLNNKRCNEGESISGRHIRNNMGWLIRGVTLIDN